MNLEIIKLLTQDIPKLIKACSILLRLLFVYAVAAWLFKLAYGPYSIVSLTDLAALQQYVTSGLVFICIFFVLITVFVLFFLMSNLIAYLFGLLESRQPFKKKMKYEEYQLVKNVLKDFNVLEIKKRARKVILKKRAKLMYEVASDFTDENAKEKVDNIKHAFIYEFVHIYFVFCLYYFILLDHSYRNGALTAILITSASVIIVSYKSFSQTLDLLCKSSPMIVSIIEDGRMDNKVHEIFED